MPAPGFVLLGSILQSVGKLLLSMCLGNWLSAVVVNSPLSSHGRIEKNHQKHKMVSEENFSHHSQVINKKQTFFPFILSSNKLSPPFFPYPSSIKQFPYTHARTHTPFPLPFPISCLSTSPGKTQLSANIAPALKQLCSAGKNHLPLKQRN